MHPALPLLLAAALAAPRVAYPPSGADAGIEGREAAPGAPASPPRPPAPPRPPTSASRLVGDWPARPSGKTVTLDEQGSLDDALEAIANAAGWSLVANTGRLGDRELSAKLRGVPVEQALEAVLEGLPLLATRHGDTVTVAPGQGAQEHPILSGFEAPTGKRFTGDFAGTPADEALTKVAEAAGLSLVLPPGLRGPVNGHFKDAPVEDVVRSLLRQAGGVGARDGAVLTVTRGGGSSLVIRGGKRELSVRVDGLDGLDEEVGRAVDAAARDARRKAAKTSGEAAKDDAAPDGGASAEGRTRRGKRVRGKQRDHVQQGDQVLKAGERADSMVALFGNARLEAGAQAREAVAVLGSVELAPGASVEEQVVAVGGDVHVGAGARVGGDAVSVGGKIVIDEGAVVEGQQTSVSVPGLGGLAGLIGGAPPGRAGAESIAWRVGRTLAQFAAFFLLGLLVLTLFPRRVENITASLVNAPVKAVLTGVLGTLAIPVVLLLLVVTLVGIPFTAVVAFGVAAATVMGYTALALYLGRVLPLRVERGATILQLAAGTALLVVIGQIPLLGTMAWISGWLFVFGVVLRTRFGAPPAMTLAPYPTRPPPFPPEGPPPAV